MSDTTLRLDFEALGPMLNAWGGYVTTQIRDQLCTKLPPDVSVDVFLRIPPKHRVKSLSSFLEKVVRHGKVYHDPLHQVTDLVGTRFVVLLTRDIEIIKAIVESNSDWSAENCRDYEQERAARPQHFDYQSVHYILKCRRPIHVGGVDIPLDMPCEVQVRTLLQHAYAELAHETVYKPVVQIDSGINRKIAKGAALIEATDDVFLSVAVEINRATNRLRELHRMASAVYSDLIGPPTSVDVRLTFQLLDPYREQLCEVTIADLENLVRTTAAVVQGVRERAPFSILFGHPVVLWLYWLAVNWRLLVPTRWPINPEYLSDIYSDLSISLGSE